MSPFLPLIGGGETKFQPVFVGDVAQAILIATGAAAKGGTIYELGGPEVKSFKALMEYVLAVTERKRLLLPIPFAVAKLQAMVLQLLPTPLLTKDQVESLRTDNIVSAAATAEGRTIGDLGIAPAALEAIVPSYLWRFRKTGQFRGRVA
jgi:NADH dehydrogenase